MDHALLHQIQINKLLALISFVLASMFVYENVRDSLKLNPKETLRLLISPLVVVTLMALGCNLPSFTQETVINFFLFQMVHNNIIIKLMLYNMCQR